MFLLSFGQLTVHKDTFHPYDDNVEFIIKSDIDIFFSIKSVIITYSTSGRFCPEQINVHLREGNRRTPAEKIQSEDGK